MAPTVALPPPPSSSSSCSRAVVTGNDDFWHELAGGAGDPEAHLTAFTEKIFDALDGDHNGTITEDELKDWLRKGRDAAAGHSDATGAEMGDSVARAARRGAAQQEALEMRMTALEDSLATMASQLADIHAIVLTS